MKVFIACPHVSSTQIGITKGYNCKVLFFFFLDQRYPIFGKDSHFCYKLYMFQRLQLFLKESMLGIIFFTGHNPLLDYNCLIIQLYILEKAMAPHVYSCLENPMDGGAWQAAVHGVAKSRTRLSDFPFTFHFHALEKEMASHSSVLAWRIPGTGEPGGLQSMGSHRVGHD